MFRFEHPELIWLLILPIGYVLLFLLRRQWERQRWAAWGTDLSNTKTLREIPRPRYRWLIVVGTTLLCLAALNPQWGYKTVNIETKSAAIYIVLDISNSMLAEDVAPNRLERAKRIAMEISNEFKSDKIGLVLFAGNAYMQSPLTTDWHAIQLYLNAAHPDQAGTQGTAIGEAVKLALHSSVESENTVPGAIIILTDGEDHDGNAPDAIKDAAEEGWVTYVIGVGTSEGGTIPVFTDGYSDVKRDEQGQPVVTRLNEDLMAQLVQKGNGRYFNLSEEATIIESLSGSLATLERSQQEKRSFSEHHSYFQWLLFPGIMLLLLSSLINFKFDVIG
jgi:Ca-activated chloride channel family protein